MEKAGFSKDLQKPQPGTWLSPKGIPVDLMVPEALAGDPKPGRRSVSIAPHSKLSARRAFGLEAAVVDNEKMVITALDPSDSRRAEVAVAGPAALLVAKLHKIGERNKDKPHRLVDKDAHDIYRLLVATDTNVVASRIVFLIEDGLAGPATLAALDELQELFAAGHDAVGSEMAGRAEELVGDPALVSAAVQALSEDLLEAVAASQR